MFNRKNSIQNLDAYVEERLSDYLDGTLSDQERAIVEAHVATSEQARASLESLRYTVSLLKQTPAPALPRQFTLPVTSRAPVKAASGWFVWGLRGVAVAATAAFAILLVATVVRQPLTSSTANAPSAQAVPSVVVAMAPSVVPPTSADIVGAANDANATPVMVTEEASPAAMQAVPVTETPAPSRKSQAGQGDSSNAPPTALPAPPQPSPQAPAPTEQPPPTSAAAAEASGASSAAPEAAVATGTATVEVFTQRTAVTLEGEVILSQLKVREGPGTQYRTIGGLRQGERVLVLGRSRDNMWLLIELARNLRTRQGWVSSAYIRLNGELQSLPETQVAEPEPPTVTPTLTETPSPELPPTTPDEFNATPTPTDAGGVPPVTPVDGPTAQPESSPTVTAPEAAPTDTPTPELPQSGAHPTPGN